VGQKQTSDSLRTWVQSQNNIAKDDPLCSGCFKVFTEKEITVDNHSAITQETFSHSAGRTLTAYIQKDSSFVIFMSGSPLGLGDPDVASTQKVLK
jgi:hypothetical protein